MIIYIASSWKNQHAVELLTDRLREAGHDVRSFIENNLFLGEEYEGGSERVSNFDAWIKTRAASKAFFFDTVNATQSDLVVYIGPSGTDAWAEVGAAWASKVPVYGLWAKGEPAGLMRKMVTSWFLSFQPLLDAIDADAVRMADTRLEVIR